MPVASKLKKAAGPPEGIVVTSQQSRFHVDAIDAPESKDITINDLTISIGGREILDHATLRLLSGVHYCFVGRNGTGKSTVLKALAERRIPGVAANLKVLLIGQTRVEDEESEARKADKGETVLDHVIRADAGRERALREAKILSEALEGPTSPSTAVKSVRQLQVEEAERRLAEAQLLAARRSGARGLQARQDLIVKEKELEEAKLRVDEAEVSAVSANPDADEVATGLSMLERVRSALEAMDSGSTEAKARTTLLGLGFSTAQLDAPFSSLSGGWRTRCSLAAALTQKTDVLLLDEPTNYLDLPAVIWLQRHVANSIPETTTVVVVTHDRDFADAAAEELLILRTIPAKSLETFKGNLSEYESERIRQRRRMMKMKAAQERQVKHMEETIAKSVKAGKRSGDDKKLKQAASRKKKMEERTGLEVSKTGGRFKLSRDRAGFQLTKRAEIEVPELEPMVSIALPEQPTQLRFPGPVLSIEGCSFRYSKTKEDLLKDVNLIVHPGDRVGVVGLNGSGKSTLIKLIMSAADQLPVGQKLAPTKGTVTIHSKARVEYYSQHSVEDLEQAGIKDPSLTALKSLLAKSAGELDEQEARATLGRLGLKGNFVSDVPLKSLSGGQRVRLALAEAVWSSPHLLVLDEVTTHLDSDTIVALIEALKEWDGALVVVTHDRFFMRCVVEGEAVDLGDDAGSDPDSDNDSHAAAEKERDPGRVYRLRNGVLKHLEGGMQKYEDLILKRLEKEGILK